MPGPGSDRIYTITYQAVDDYGNTTVRSATASIPHNFKVLARIAAQWLWTNPTGRIQGIYKPALPQILSYQRSRVTALPRVSPKIFSTVIG